MLTLLFFVNKKNFTPKIPSYRSSNKTLKKFEYSTPFEKVGEHEHLMYMNNYLTSIFCDV